jgi:hypothetical protein
MAGLGSKQDLSGDRWHVGNEIGQFAAGTVGHLSQLKQRKPITEAEYTYFYLNLTASHLTIIKALRASPR